MLCRLKCATAYKVISIYEHKGSGFPPSPSGTARSSTGYHLASGTPALTGTLGSGPGMGHPPVLQSVVGSVSSATLWDP